MPFDMLRHVILTTSSDAHRISPNHCIRYSRAYGMRFNSHPEIAYSVQLHICIALTLKNRATCARLIEDLWVSAR